VKCPELEILGSYEDPPKSTYWEKFPSCELPGKVTTKIDVKALESLIDKLGQKLLPSEIIRAKKVVDYLTNGAPSFQMENLPACMQKNASSTKYYAKEITDTFAFWMKSEFLCGPFDTPPVKKFRVNPVMVKPSDNKVRPILNVSQPAGNSFNDNVNIKAMEKVKMSSARSFGYTLKNCGFDAVFSKFDLKDAYKNIPAPIEDLRLQGFKWLNKYFIETKQIFGARTAVANFDVLGNTILALARATSNTANCYVHRHLDDIPIAGPSNSNICETFSNAYAKVCEEINVKIADNCPMNEKAFKNATHGKVLGIWFDSKDLSWNLPQEKREKTLSCIHEAVKNEKISLLNMQKLMGNLNNVSLMCPFLNGFRKNLNDCLGHMQKNEICNMQLSVQAKNDLLIWTGCLIDDTGKLPIPSMPSDPPLYCKSFTSDAAGYSDDKRDKKPDKPGVAAVGFNEDGKVIFAHRKFWDKTMISNMKDKDGKLFGRKTAFLEFVGLMLPFISIPGKLKNQHIVLRVDNISCHYGWENRCMKNCVYTSILIRALHIISSYLCSIIHVQHLPRLSTWDSCLVDRLSRELTTETEDAELLEKVDIWCMPMFFEKWIDHPTEDWNIPLKLLNYVKNK